MLRQLLLSVALTAALLVSAPSAARACNGGVDGNFLAAVALVAVTATAVNVVFTVGDLTNLANEEPRSFGYGFAEVLLTAPQAVLAVAGTASASCLACGLWALWTVSLSAHGIYTMANQPGARSAPVVPTAPQAGRGSAPLLFERRRPPDLRPTLAIAPTFFADRGKELPGVVALVRF